MGLTKPIDQKINWSAAELTGYRASDFHNLNEANFGELDPT
ncbi:MAG: hypothetical protein SRB1_00506 [Desulfobacteraceae bacterium Eth-SRB1]|nr:MAG: hypothetical protein SRB1_00506 [Desulfobacteraceae bacterium Eth-SRB1]